MPIDLKITADPTAGQTTPHRLDLGDDIIGTGNRLSAADVAALGLSEEQAAALNDHLHQRVEFRAGVLVSEAMTAARSVAAQTASREQAFAEGYSRGRQQAAAVAAGNSDRAALVAERARWGAVLAGLVAEDDDRLKLAVHLLSSSEMTAAEVSSAAAFVPERNAAARSFAAVMGRFAEGAPSEPIAAEFGNDPANPTPEQRAEFGQLFRGMGSPYGEIAGTRVAD